MADAESPVNYESRHGITMVSQRHSSDQLIDFNNDSTTTFDDVRRYFRALEARVLEKGSADLDREAEQVEIEIYEGGNGVIRTYNGWFAVAGFNARSSTIHFQIDTTREIAPNALDREILVRAAKIISSRELRRHAATRTFTLARPRRSELHVKSARVIAGTDDEISWRCAAVNALLKGDDSQRKVRAVLFACGVDRGELQNRHFRASFNTRSAHSGHRR